MNKIQANRSGTRYINVSDEHLEVIKKYHLLKGLVDSSKIIDEETLDRLKLTARGLLESESGNNKELLDLCLDVLYHSDMKILGLTNLIKLYNEWLAAQVQSNPAVEEAE